MLRYCSEVIHGHHTYGQCEGPYDDLPWMRWTKTSMDPKYIGYHLASNLFCNEKTKTNGTMLETMFFSISYGKQGGGKECPGARPLLFLQRQGHAPPFFFTETECLSVWVCRCCCFSSESVCPPHWKFWNHPWKDRHWPNDLATIHLCIIMAHIILKQMCTKFYSHLNRPKYYWRQLVYYKYKKPWTWCTGTQVEPKRVIRFIMTWKTKFSLKVLTD